MNKMLLIALSMLFASCVLVVGDDDAHIEIDRDDYHATSNWALEERIEENMSADQQLAIKDFHVTSKKDTVYLHGKTSQADDIARAISIAMADEEVERVSSRIIVTSERN